MEVAHLIAEGHGGDQAEFRIFNAAQFYNRGLDRHYQAYMMGGASGTAIFRTLGLFYAGESRFKDQAATMLRNDVAALKWFILGEEQGDNLCRKRAEELRSRLSEADVARARSEAKATKDHIDESRAVLLRKPPVAPPPATAG